MNIESFRKDLLESVWAAAESNRDFQRAAFVEEAANRLVDADEVTDFEKCTFEGIGARSRKLQVDGYAFDDVDNSLRLMIADFSGDESIPVLGRVDGTRLFGMLRGFVESALDGRLTDGSVDESTPGFGLASDIRAWRESITRFRFYLVTDGQLSSHIKDWPEEEIDGTPAEFHIWDIVRFHRAFESSTGRDDLEVDFREFGCEGLPCIKAGEVAGEYEAYLCMIPGDVLADVYEKYGSRLLEGNVRSFLSAKGKVNSGIQSTIRSAPEMFFAYNNGIAATAKATELEQSKHGLRIVRATDLQIVNGGQTTASLATAKRKDGADLSAVSVQMKLSVIDGEKAGTMIPNIAKFANSQNKVSEADFFANHPYHIRMEEFSRRIWTPPPAGQLHGTHWFYERARGQYLNEQVKLSRAQKAQFQLQNPRQQLISKTDLAKFENTWRGVPHKVSLGAQKNFLIFADLIAKGWAENDLQFNEEYFRRVVALGILFRHTEKLVAEQPWYQNGYRANIVTYSLAKLQLAASEQGRGKEFDMRKVWERQAIPSEVNVELIRISKAVFEVLTNPDSGIQNVTEWAKKELCWHRVRDLDYKLSSPFLQQLASKDVLREIQKDAVTTQEIDSGIGAQVEVLRTTKADWSKMKKWADAKGLLTPKESQIFDTAAHPARIPSDKQSVAILAIRKKILAEGYSR